MKAYQERVVLEAAELDTKIMKLEDFTITLPFTQLPPVEQDILRRQLAAMEEYLFLLNLRIWNCVG